MIGSAAATFLLSAIACGIAGRLAIPILLRAQRVTPARYGDCPPLLTYDEAKQGTPTMGGLFVLAVGLAAAALGGGLRDPDGRLVLVAVVGLGALGLFDDCLKFRGGSAAGLRSLPKLLIALGLGAALGLASLSPSAHAMRLDVPWMREPLVIGWAWVPLAMLVVAGCAHAVNLTDGMDGLAAGCVAIALSALGCLVSAADGPGSAMVPWCAGLAGACVGFLWFNSFPATIFLGDVGALGLGAALGAVSLLTRNALWLLILGGVFVVEALSVMLQVASYQWRGGRRIFRVAPLHHHFHLGGTTEPKLIVRFWIVGLLLAALGLTAVRLP